MLPQPAQTDIERAGAAMALLGLLEAEDQRAQVGQAQPMRHHPAQYAPFVTEQSRRQSALAGHHQGDAAAAPLLATQEGMERQMRLVLPHAVQVDGSIDALLAATQLRAQTPLDRRQRRG